MNSEAVISATIETLGVSREDVLAYAFKSDPDRIVIVVRDGRKLTRPIPAELMNATAESIVVSPGAVVEEVEPIEEPESSDESEPIEEPKHPPIQSHKRIRHKST